MNGSLSPEYLKRLAFLASTTDDEARQLAAVARRLDYPLGSVLFREGQQLSHFHIVVSGRVAIEVIGPGRVPQLLHTVGAGELLGWSPLLGSSTMTATARAHTDVSTVLLEARAVLAICDADPRFGYVFMRRVANAIAARLNACRLHALDVFRDELPTLPSGAGGTPT
jgi:CRP-like cAMP-binding protein